jgi:hypothetical protein
MVRSYIILGWDLLDGLARTAQNYSRWVTAENISESLGAVKETNAGERANTSNQVTPKGMIHSFLTRVLKEMKKCSHAGSKKLYSLISLSFSP